MTTKTNFGMALLTASALFACTLHGANAAPAPIGGGPTKLAEASQGPTPAAVEDDDAATCNKSRKRLWVEGEGWIVRKVTICR